MLKNVLLVLLIGGAIAGYFFYEKYRAVMSPNVPEKLKQEYIFIPTNSTFNELSKILLKNKQVIDTTSFREVAEMMSFVKPTMRSGRYKIEPNWSNRQLISHLRAGEQSPMKLTLSTGRILADVAGKAAQFIEADSTDIANLLFDENYIGNFGYTEETLMSLFIPNTYEFYWNKNEKDFFKRMVKEHDRFWKKNNRLKKAKALGMSAIEVYTLASIVERETNKNEEKKRIAGVYLNRLKKGILLQADPTVVFANNDFSIRRVRNRHTRLDSPYNTYKYPGLPPGPISMASISSIDAVLNAENHDYFYFCAQPGGTGYHAFAKSLAGHNRNAKKFHRWMDSQKFKN